MSEAAAKPVAAQPTPIKTPRMTLKSIQKGKARGPYRVLIYGVDGVGKSTFGAEAPTPVFLGTEDGTEHLDVARFPAPHTWGETLEAVRALTADAGEHKTLVIDSLDWMEPLLWREVCERSKVTTIEEVGGGFGKGYNAAIDDWRVLLAALERLQRERGVNVVLIAHAFIKKFQNPEGEDFDRYILKLNEKAAGVVREWCNAVLFANYETFAVKDKAKRVRGVSSGARLIYTERTAAYDAKNRYGLPPELPLSWAEFDRAARAGQPADPVALREEIQRKAASLNEAEKEKALSALERAGNDAVKLSQINNYVNAKAAAKAAESQATK